MAIATHRSVAVVLFNQKRTNPSENPRPPSPPRSRSVLLPCNPSIRVPAVCELAATPPVVMRRDREPPEHGYHRSHGTNTDKPIGVSMAIATRRRVAVVLFNQKCCSVGSATCFVAHPEQIGVVSVHSVYPCSGCLRSLGGTVSGDPARWKTARTRITPISPNQHG